MLGLDYFQSFGSGWKVLGSGSASDTGGHKPFRQDSHSLETLEMKEKLGGVMKSGANAGTQLLYESHHTAGTRGAITCTVHLEPDKT